MTDYAIADTKEDWLEIRSKGLGGSDIGTMMGLNPYKSAYQLWLEKTGQAESPDISDKIAIKVGNELEDLVARIFEQETGLKVQKDNKTHFHKDFPFLLANIDRKIVGERALLECKTTSVFNADEWKDDEVPASYLMQVQHYLNVLNYDYAYIAVIVGNSRFICKKIERDEELITLYTNMAMDFWLNNVLNMVAPEIDGSMVTKQALNLVEYEEGKSKPMTKEQEELAKYIENLKSDIKHLNDMKSQAENQLKEQMSNDELSELTSSKLKVTWKSISHNRVDTDKLKKQYPEIYQECCKESSYKKLTIKEIK